MLQESNTVSQVGGEQAYKEQFPERFNMLGTGLTWSNSSNNWSVKRKPSVSVYLDGVDVIAWQLKGLEAWQTTERIPWKSSSYQSHLTISYWLKQHTTWTTGSTEKLQYDRMRRFWSATISSQFYLLHRQSSKLQINELEIDSPVNNEGGLQDAATSIKWMDW